ncbi:hypothetical protein ACFSYG_09515 [Leeuwenhoekiella polynyae]|uniref:Uncharacterized protein n=1 Tax=Leeuwenhoekiella polynyae TaxID=1550906 RepID=A0A4Q0PGL8_9FLAO|nr:hypothetical protein [Leeuwenhoekiella polynyae]RXG26045.1 hypothetical protein DSM02_36 [Leeuwenhoekiella polynyae]
MNNNNGIIIKLKNHLDIITSGDIEKIPVGDSIFSKSFIDYNNQFIKSNYDANYNLFAEILRKIPGASRIVQNTKRGLSYIAEISPELQKMIDTGEAYISKSNVKEGNYSANVLANANNSKKGILGQVTLKEIDLTAEQIDNLLSTAQLMNIQQSIASLSGQIKDLDEKLNIVLYGAHNDRLAHIQSAYNMFLQTRVSEKYKDLLFPVIISQLSLGREQLIYSLKYDLEQIASKKTGFKAIIDGFTEDNLLSKQRERYYRIKQSLSFIIRSSQLLALVYQDMNEPKMVAQALIRVNEVLSSFDTNAKRVIIEWAPNEEEAEQMFFAIEKTEITMNNYFEDLPLNNGNLHLKIDNYET